MEDQRMSLLWVNRALKLRFCRSHSYSALWPSYNLIPYAKGGGGEKKAKRMENTRQLRPLNTYHMPAGSNMTLLRAFKGTEDDWNLGRFTVGEDSEQGAPGVLARQSNGKPMSPVSPMPLFLFSYKAKNHFPNTLCLIKKKVTMKSSKRHTNIRMLAPKRPLCLAHTSPATFTQSLWSRFPI